MFGFPVKLLISYLPYDAIFAGSGFGIITEGSACGNPVVCMRNNTMVIAIDLTFYKFELAL
jgi:hypothetical protein